MQVAPNAVLKAVRDGRISRAVIYGVGGKIKGIRWRQAKSLWYQNTDPAQALKSRKHEGPAPEVPVQTSGPARPSSSPATATSLQRELSDLIGRIFGASAIAWAADIAVQHHLSPADALDCIEAGLFAFNVAADEVLGTDPKREIAIPPELDVGDKRLAAIERVAVLAAKFRRELQ
jgi:hypothetical protein